MLGCGELNEGQNYEAIMAAYHFRLNNLTAIVDYNGLQFDGRLEDVLDPGSLKRRWESFNWNVIEINGHDMDEILPAFAEAKAMKDVPTVIIARTIKGKGVPMMEGDYLWHSLMDNKALAEFCVSRRRELENEDEFYAGRLW
jgi:transketolase